MKKSISIMVCLISLLSYGQGNSFESGKPWLDNQGVHINAHGGGVLFADGLYYWYGEFKTAGRRGNVALKGVSCYTSKDLYHWDNKGIVLQVEEDPTSDITVGCVIERPKVVFNKKTGKYVMWFHLELKGKGYEAARAGIATSDTPLGPFKFVKSIRPNKGLWPIAFQNEFKQPLNDEKSLKSWSPEWLLAVKNGMLVRRDFDKGQMSRDMTLFVDDNQKAYLIHSAEDNLTLHISQLSDDYLDVTGKWTRVAPAGHNEAPALVKKDKWYYMITSGCTGWEPNAARSFRSKSIWGPWESLGNPCQGEDADLTFHSQSTFILPVQGKQDQFIFMADRWKPSNAIDGSYVWLPLSIKNGKPNLKWQDTWNLGYFDLNLE